MSFLKTPLVSDKRAKLLKPTQFNPAAFATPSKKTFIPPPSSSKTQRWVDNTSSKMIAEQNRINQAIFLAEHPADAVKDFAKNLSELKAIGVSFSDFYRESLGKLIKKGGINFTEQDADGFVLRNTKKLLGELQALYIKNNRPAFEKLKKLGGLKGTVTKKARRVYRKYYGRRR